MKKTVTVGFDGFIDSLVKPIKNVSKNEYFSDIKQFGEFISSKANVSCSIELFEKERKFGGNMPHLAYSLAFKGANVNAIGMLGESNIAKEFEPLKNCKLYSYMDPGFATALEFNDGKVFLAPTISIKGDAFDKVSNVFDMNLLITNDVFALVNWSELSFSHKLWNDIYYNIFDSADLDKSKYVFFDLCDCARKSDEEIKAVLKLISLYNTKRSAILSLNENEANTLAKVYDIQSNSLEETAKKLRMLLNIDEIIIHTTKKSVLSTVRNEVSRDTLYIEKPAISTGSGDNFNATYIFAKLHEKPDEECLKIANFGAGFYVKNGKCANFSDMSEVL